MSWIAPALPYISAATSIAAGRQASTIGKYNQAVQNRNAQIAEQEVQAIEQQKNLDIQKFEKQFTQLQGETKTAILKSGVDLSGSGLRILRYNAEQAEVEKDIMNYNSKVAQSQALEQANFARIKGQVARQEGKYTAMKYYSQAGTTLLKMYE